MFLLRVGSHVAGRDADGTMSMTDHHTCRHAALRALARRPARGRFDRSSTPTEMDNHTICISKLRNTSNHRSMP